MHIPTAPVGLSSVPTDRQKPTKGRLLSRCGERRGMLFVFSQKSWSSGNLFEVITSEASSVWLHMVK